MKIGELASRCGLTAHTLRYYERIGLLPDVPRDGAGQRQYDRSILMWIAFLQRLKITGMPIREMLLYAQLRHAGSATAAERLRLLAFHRQRVQANIIELQSALVALDAKIDAYASAANSQEE